MKLWKAVMVLPQPMKSSLHFLMAAFLLTVLGIILTLVFRSSWTVLYMRLSIGIMAAAIFLIGIILATDFRGSARAYSEMLKVYKPMGLDYGQSPLTRPPLIRVFGAAYSLAAVWFAVYAFTFTPKLGG